VIGWTVGVGAIVVVSIGTLAAIPSSGQKPTQIPIPGSATTALPQLQKLGPDGLIPKNIAETVLVPVGLKVMAYKDLNPNGTNFDGYVMYRASMSPAKVLAFFKASLPDAGWHLYDAGVTKGQDVIVASKAAWPVLPCGCPTQMKPRWSCRLLFPLEECCFSPLFAPWSLSVATS